MITNLETVISEYSVRNKNDEDIPVYSVTNDNGFCTGYFSKEIASKDKSTYKIVPRGYFAYNPSRINVGSIDWQNCEDQVIVSPLYVVFGISGAVDRQYLLYYLKSDIASMYINAYATGSVRDILKLTDLCKIPILLRPLDEQRKIAAVLDKISDLTAKRRRQLDKLDELVKSRFVEMFGDLIINNYCWHFQPLSKICDVRDGTHDSPQYVEVGYPLLTSKNFSSGIIDFTECNFIAPEDFDTINKRSKVDCGDIVMPMIGTIGHAVIVDTDTPFAIKNVALIKFNGCVFSNIFIRTILESDYFNYVVNLSSRGATQKFIALSDIRQLPIPVVPIELQNQFADFVKAVEKSKSTIRRSLTTLETLKKSLMQEYFSVR